MGESRHESPQLNASRYWGSFGGGDEEHLHGFLCCCLVAAQGPVLMCPPPTSKTQEHPRGLLGACWRRHVAMSIWLLQCFSCTEPAARSFWRFHLQRSSACVLPGEALVRPKPTVTRLSLSMCRGPWPVLCARGRGCWPRSPRKKLSLERQVSECSCGGGQGEPHVAGAPLWACGWAGLSSEASTALSIHCENAERGSPSERTAALRPPGLVCP